MTDVALADLGLAIFVVLALALAPVVIPAMIDDMDCARRRREWEEHQARESARMAAEAARERAYLEQQWREERREQEEGEKRAAVFRAQWEREEAARKQTEQARIAVRDRNPAGHFYKWLRGS